MEIIDEVAQKYALYEKTYNMKPGTPEWDRAWQALADELKTPLERIGSWQYMGPDSTYKAHSFRLRAGYSGNMTGSNKWVTIAGRDPSKAQCVECEKEFEREPSLEEPVCDGCKELMGEAPSLLEAAKIAELELYQMHEHYCKKCAGGCPAMYALSTLRDAIKKEETK